MLNVDEVDPNPELVNLVPQAVALFYLALPLAQEDGEVSVAMVHPENTAALATLSRLLNAPIVPVRGTAVAIRAALLALQPAPATASGILSWSAGGEGVAAVAAWTEHLAAALDLPATVLLPTQAGLDDCLDRVAREHYRLTVLTLPPALPLTAVLGRTGPLFLVRSDEVRPLRRILVVLRGFASDEQALDLALALAKGSDAALTLLSLADRRVSALQEILAGPKGLATAFRRPGLGHLHTGLKARQGDAIGQICDEAAEGDYDLLLISAEGEGAFVANALAELERRHGHRGRPLLFIKPIRSGRTQVAG